MRLWTVVEIHSEMLLAESADAISRELRRDWLILGFRAANL